MKISQPVDFETFSFIFLLEMIEKQGNESLTGSLREKLNRFIAFLREGENPPARVEDLARLPGTSDLSIFFSDLMEHIKDYPPENVLDRTAENARDFLNLFNELASESDWEKNVLDQLTGEKPEEMAVSFSLNDFIHAEIKQRVARCCETLEAEKQNRIDYFLSKCEKHENIEDLLKPYREVAELENETRLLKSLYQLPLKGDGLEEYIQNFYTRIDEFSHGLVQLSQDNPVLFETFCRLEALPAAPPEKKAEEQAVLEEAARKLEDRSVVEPQTMEEDRQLRWLLRDYIIHEIESLTNELKVSLDALHQHPDDENKREAVLNVLKILKDLGQIHRYHGIDTISNDTLEMLSEFFSRGKTLTRNASALLLSLCRSFTEYIDWVLNEKEEEGMVVFNRKKQQFFASLEVEALVPDQIAFADRKRIQEVFQEVNARCLDVIQHKYEMLLDQTGATAIPEELVRQLKHLDFWYGVFDLNTPREIIEEMLGWETAFGWIERQEAVEKVIHQLKNHLFDSKESSWVELAANIKGEKPVAEALDITRSLSAFKEVTLRQLNEAGEVLRNKELLPQSALAHYRETLWQIARNSELVKNDGLQLVCTGLLSKTGVENRLPNELLPEYRKVLSDLLATLQQAVEKFPEPLQPNEFLQKHEKALDELLSRAELPQEEPVAEPGAETRAPSREEFIDTELQQVFRDEAQKYLADIENHLRQLETDLSDKNALVELGHIVHTLKGSAQMLNQSHLSQLAEPLENITELIQEDKLQLDASLIPLFDSAVAAIRERLVDEQYDVQNILRDLDGYIGKFSKRETAEEIPEEIRAETGAEEVIEKVVAEQPEEVPEETTEERILKLSEQDPELLDIFRNEAISNLDSIESNLSLIEKFTYDKKTLHDIDQSIHEVQAAAKMLGFQEIGVLMDSMEQVVEKAVVQMPDDWSEIITVLRKIVSAVRTLTKDLQISREAYDGALDKVRKLLATLAETEKVAPGEPTPAPRLEPSDQVMEAFLQEAREYLEDINFLLMKMEKDPENEEMSYHLLRSLHTLKGSAAMVYVEPVEKLAHLSEDVVETYQKKGLSFPQSAFDLLFEVVDEIEFIVDSMASGMSGKTRNYEAILERLQGHHHALEPTVETQQVTAEAEPSPEPKVEEAGEPKEFLEISRGTKKRPVVPRDAYVRLHVDQMDRLLNEAAELVINHTQFKTQLERFKNYLPRMDVEGKNLQNILWYLETIINEQRRLMDMIRPHIGNNPSIEESQKTQVENIERAIHNLQVFQKNLSETIQGMKESEKTYEEQVQKVTHLSTQIHDEIMEARLVPVGLLFQRFHRPLRDLARKNEKKIKFYTEGENAELDRALIEELYEPLLHILRNAIDHGIETPAERKKAGKPEEGEIHISAVQERNFVNIEVRDDGRGIDMEKVRKRLIEAGLLEEEQALQLPDQDLFEYLMYPGFSTSETTTELSGRGVGLDVVKKQLQKIKGDIRVYSEQGKGSRFLIRVPISLTVTQAMLVEISGHIYAVPLMQVEETSNVSLADLEIVDNTYFMKHRGRKIPVVYMANLLKIRGDKQKAISPVGTYPVIVVQDEGNEVALLMEKIVHREEVLIKSLGPGMQRVPYIMGGSVLADGRVVLVLDVPQIVREARRGASVEVALSTGDVVLAKQPEKEAGEAKEEKPAPKRWKKITDRKPTVLVVDDSLSIRKFLAGLLSNQGFEVDMAKNGYHALEILNQKEFDMVITDLEMPHLSGYELIEQIRAENRWEDLPVIVLTGRASKHIQQLSMNLGADEFIIKPFKEDELLDKIGMFLKWR